MLLWAHVPKKALSLPNAPCGRDPSVLLNAHSIHPPKIAFRPPEGASNSIHKLAFQTGHPPVPYTNSQDGLEVKSATSSWIALAAMSGNHKRALDPLTVTGIRQGLRQACASRHGAETGDRSRTI